MLLLRALAGRRVKLWKTNVVGVDGAEPVPLQEGSPKLACIIGKSPPKLCPCYYNLPSYHGTSTVGQQNLILIWSAKQDKALLLV